MSKKLIFTTLLFLSITLFGQPVPVMGPISGSSTVCSAPSAPATFSTSATNSPNFYNWSVSPSQGVVISNPNSSITTIDFPNTSTVYVITCFASNNSGPSNAPASTTVTVFETPQVTFSGANVFCQGSPTNIQASPTTISASSTISYSWIPAAGLSATNVPDPIANPLATTIYTVIYAIGSCSNAATFVASVVPLPQVIISSTSFSICTYQTYNLNFYGTAINYSLNGLPIFPTSTGVSVNSPTLSPGAYTYTFTGDDNYGCIGSTLSNFTIYPEPTVNAVLSKTVLCQNETAILSILGNATTYSLNGTPTGTSIPITGGITPNPLIITGLNNFGCSTAIAESFTVNPLPQVNANLSSGLICKTQSSTLSISGTASGYSLNGTPINTSTVFSGSMPNGTYIYTVSGINSFNCTNSTTSTLTVAACNDIDEINNNAGASLKLYPNPASGKFYIESNSTGEVLILDQSGKIILKLKVEENTETVVNGLSPGLYFVFGLNHRKKIIITE